MAELSKGEITILSVQGDELYAYINQASAGKDWPQQMEHLNLRYQFDDKWDLPVEMRTFVQAARYLLIMP